MTKSIGKWLAPTAGLALLGALLVQAGVLGKSSTGAGSARSATPPVSQTAAIKRVHAEGRLVAYPDASATIAAELGGLIKRVAVVEKQDIRKGQLLAELDADQLEAELAEARARAAEASAQLRLETIELDRTGKLLTDGAVTERDGDRARSARDTARARLGAAQAAIRRLVTLVDKTRITAPLDGTVISRRIEPGETVEVGAILFEVANLARTRVEAEVDEYDAGRLAVGASVRIRAEGLTGSWRGAIEEIPDAVSARQLRPQDPGRPSDTRVLLVKVAAREPLPLKLGQRAEVEIDAR